MKRTTVDAPNGRRETGPKLPTPMLPAGALCAPDQEFPVTIHTKPLRLVDVEILAARRDAFTQRFIAHPERIDTLATILHARDEETRRRFDSRVGLVAYLRALLLG